jgi:hypothetical protein
MSQFITIMERFLLYTFLSQSLISMLVLNIVVNEIMFFLLSTLSTSFSINLLILSLQQMGLLLDLKFPLI